MKKNRKDKKIREYIQEGLTSDEQKWLKERKMKTEAKKIIREIFQDNFPKLKDTKPLD